MTNFFLSQEIPKWSFYFPFLAICLRNWVRCPRVTWTSKSLSEHASCVAFANSVQTVSTVESKQWPTCGIFAFRSRFHDCLLKSTSAAVDSSISWPNRRPTPTYITFVGCLLQNDVNNVFLHPRWERKSAQHWTALDDRRRVDWRHFQMVQCRKTVQFQLWWFRLSSRSTIGPDQITTSTRRLVSGNIGRRTANSVHTIGSKPTDSRSKPGRMFTGKLCIRCTMYIYDLYIVCITYHFKC